MIKINREFLQYISACINDDKGTNNPY